VETYTTVEEFLAPAGRPAPSCLVPQCIPIVFIIAHDDEQARREAPAAGAMVFLQFPSKESYPMTKTSRVLLAGSLLAALVAGLSGTRGTPADPPGAAAAEDPRRKADEEAIRKQSVAFVRAFEQGDVKTLAGLWTEEGEYIDDDGTTLRGRRAIAEAYTKLFAENPRRKLEVNVESVRFVSRDSAIEDGVARVVKGNDEKPTFSRYSILYAREDGRWLMAVVREWPDERATLKQLDWLIGSWAARSDDGEVHTSYEWDEGRHFIRGRFTIKDRGRTISGTQRIGKDPRTGQLRSWLFGQDGGFGEATWSWDGRHWVIEATGVMEDGTEMTATNILTPRGRDAFTWQSTNRTVDGEAAPDVPPIKVTRVR
jgi:uncharacterized protein (TIGR02246 family)